MRRTGNSLVQNRATAYTEGNDMKHTECSGCKAILPATDGPTHDYMEASPACYALFNKLLACEYSDTALLPYHRLTVDTYAVQHPGDYSQRRQIQSVGLHLARLCLQLSHPTLPKETNDIMLNLGPHKASLIALPPPASFSMTVKDVADHAGQIAHSTKVKEWAAATWQDWAEHHDYIKAWIEKAMIQR